MAPYELMKDMISTFVVTLARASTPFFVYVVYKQRQDIKLLSTKVGELADGMREEKTEEVPDNRVQEQLDALAKAVTTLSMPYKVVELSLCAGDHDKSMECGKMMARFILEEDELSKKFEQPGSPAKTKEEELEKLKLDLKVYETWVEKRKEDTALMEDLIEQSRKDIVEREERWAREKGKGKQSSQHQDTDSVGTVEEETKEADPEGEGQANPEGAPSQQDLRRAGEVMQFLGIDPATTTTICINGRDLPRSAIGHHGLAAITP